MKKLFTIFILLVISGSLLVAASWNAIEEDADRELKNNNYKDAFLLYKKVILHGRTNPPMYLNAIKSLKKARLENEFDSFFAAVAKKYGKDPLMAIALAQSKILMPAYGYLIAGEFVRGNHRGGGERVSCLERDRVEAMNILLGIPAKNRTGAYYRALSDILMRGRQYNQAWKLQYLTEINKLPAYEKQNRYYRGYQAYGAPVGSDGKAIFYHVPKSFDEAVNDGERWRFALQKTMSDDVKLKLAAFFKSQFGVNTIAYNMRNKIQSVKTGPYALHLLKDDESIAKLATGVQRVALPIDCNYMEMYKDLLGGNYARQALEMLARIYKNRRQYTRSANVLRELIRKFPKKAEKTYVKELNQITGNWVELLGSKTYPAGVNPEVNLKFRNTSKISCKLTKIKIETFLADIRKNLKDPAKRKKILKLGYQPQQMGNWMLNKEGEPYLGEIADEWNENLEAADEHFDKIIPMKLDVSKAGVYLLEVTAKNGNTSRIIVWLTNTAIVERDANGGKLYIVTDALTGKALDFCRLKFFGFKSKYIRDKSLRNKLGERYTYTFKDFFTQTDANGMVFIESKKLKECGKVMIEASVDDHFGVLGFSSLYFRGFNSQKMGNRRKVYAITDRPIYKPGQTVNFN